MTEGRSEGWLVTSGAASRPVRTRRADDTTLEVTVGGGAEARTLTATIVACSEDACVVSIAGRSTTVRFAPHEQGGHAVAGGESFAVAAAGEGADARDGGGPDTHDGGGPDARDPDARDGGGPDARAPSPADHLDALAAPMPTRSGRTGRTTAAAAHLDALAAPMPATVAAVLVRPGAVVAAGDTLVRLEAMKMELAIRAPAAGRVAAVDCRAGELVQPGRPLVTLEPRPAPSPPDEAPGA